jgi:hypothetical protein
MTIKGKENAAHNSNGTGIFMIAPPVSRYRKKSMAGRLPLP